MAYRVLLPQDIAEEGKEYLRKCGYEIKMGSGTTEEDIIKDVEDCDAILARTAKITGKVLEAGKRLKIVARHGVGYDNIDLKKADELGIWVTNNPGVTTQSVSEFALCGILMAARRMREIQEHLRQGEYYYKNSHKGMELKGKTLGIIGIGSIGTEVARKAYYGFDMKIIAYSPRKKQEDMPEYVTLVSWEELFSQSDIVSLHVPLSNETRGFIGAREFHMMKSTASLVNCSRGGVVVEADVIDALKAGEIAGLFTDVTEEEPPAKDHPFFSMENVVVTPHMASNTEDCTISMGVHAAMQIEKALSGDGPDCVVNHVAVARKG